MDQINIETETRITYEIYKQFYLFCLSKRRFYKQWPKLIYIISIIGIIVSIFSGFSFGFDIVTTTIPIILVVSSLLTMYLRSSIPKKYYKSSNRNFSGSIKYKFTNDYIYVESNAEGASSSSKINYTNLYKIYEIDDMLYMFINITQAYIIKKKNLNLEEIQQLRIFLKNKVGKAYITYLKD